MLAIGRSLLFFSAISKFREREEENVQPILFDHEDAQWMLMWRLLEKMLSRWCLTLKGQTLADHKSRLIKSPNLCDNNHWWLWSMSSFDNPKCWASAGEEHQTVSLMICEDLLTRHQTARKRERQITAGQNSPLADPTTQCTSTLFLAASISVQVYFYQCQRIRSTYCGKPRRCKWWKFLATKICILNENDE